MKLKCSECGNTDTWHAVQMDNNKLKATCGVCGNKVTSKPGVETKTITGGMRFNL
jgi:ribosomal protein S27E